MTLRLPASRELDVDLTPGLSALARTLTAYPSDALLVRASAADAELRAAARLLAAEARAADPVRCERLLMALRDGWKALPEVQRLPVEPQQKALWDRLVAVCVEEFYASPAGDPASAIASA